MASYETLIRARNDAGNIPHKVVAIDPGDHIGWATFEDGILTGHGVHFSPANTHLRNIEWLNDFIHVARPTVVVCEDYRIYRTKASAHINSNVPTLKLIGAIEIVCNQLDIMLVMQSAAEGKGFVTDKRLKAWGFPPAIFRSPHSADAVRHGVHYLLFGGYPL